MASDILIVDDEADIRELISGILEDEGHGTRLAKDSDETLAAIEERRPSLVRRTKWLRDRELRPLPASPVTRAVAAHRYAPRMGF